MKTYIITGVKYGDEPHYHDWDKKHEFPFFKEIDTQKWTLQANNLDECEMWLLTNHPEYYMGASIVLDSKETSEFLCTAVPDITYGEGMYETMLNRLAYAALRLIA